MKKKTDHIVLRPPMTLACLRCGESYDVAVPAPVDVVSAASKAFEKSHRACKLTDRGEACVFCFGFGHAPSGCPAAEYGGNVRRWLAGPDTGASSIALCKRLVGNFTGDSPPHPWDPDDFGRCHRLLHAMPGWRARIGEAAELSPTWERLVAAWDELEKLYLEELPSGRAPKLYARMRGLVE